MDDDSLPIIDVVLPAAVGRGRMNAINMRSRIGIIVLFIGLLGSGKHSRRDKYLLLCT